MAAKTEMAPPVTLVDMSLILSQQNTRKKKPFLNHPV